MLKRTRVTSMLLYAFNMIMDVIGGRDKIRSGWEMKKINGIHTGTTSLISQDHFRLDSFSIAHNIVHLVKTNPGIQIKTLIADMLQRFGYTMTYKKAWTTKQKGLEIAFESWEKSYSYLPVWMTIVQHFVPSTIVRYKTSASMEDEFSKVILNCVFRVFKSYIKGFQYCNPIMQVDGTFLIQKYRDTLLIVIG